MSMSNQPLSSSIVEANETEEEEDDDDDDEELSPPMVGVGVRLRSQRGMEWGCSGSQFMDMGKSGAEDDDLGDMTIDAEIMEFL